MRCGLGLKVSRPVNLSGERWAMVIRTAIVGLRNVNGITDAEAA
jgi:hypothetical protein